MNDPIDQIAAALAEASKKLRNPERNRAVTVKHKAGGQHSYTYATLDAIFDAVRPALAEAGIAIVQPLVYREGKPFLVTRLIHSSGQSIEHELPIIIDPANDKMNQTQAFGSALTYARRYGIETLLPISAEHDDDGQEAGGSDPVEAPTCPKCGKSDRVIKSKHGPGWYCLKPCSTAFGEAAEPKAAEVVAESKAEASIDGHCPTCDEIGRKTQYTKDGTLFCGQCRKVFQVEAIA